MLTFRGTEFFSISNWITDLAAFYVSYDLCDNDCKVHKGFYDLYQRLSQHVIKHVKLYMDKYDEEHIMYELLIG